MGKIEKEKEKKWSPFPRCNLRCDPEVEKQKNACYFKRDTQTVVKKILNGPTIRNGQIQYCVASSRYSYIPLFQDRGISDDKILRDVIINGKLSVYNGREKHNIFDNDGNSLKLEHLRSEMHWRVMVIQICDSALMKKKNLSPEDILVDVNDPESEVREGILLHGDGYEEISPGTDEFEIYPLTMCFNFNDDLVHVCSSESGENIVFDKGLFAIFVYRIYMPIFMSARRLKYRSDAPELYEFGEEFNVSDADSGCSILVDVNIEYAYKDSVSENGELKLNEKLIIDLIKQFSNGSSNSSSN